MTDTFDRNEPTVVPLDWPVLSAGSIKHHQSLRPGLPKTLFKLVKPKSSRRLVDLSSS